MMGVLDGEDYDVLLFSSPTLAGKPKTDDIRYATARVEISPGNLIWVNSMGAYLATSESGVAMGIAIAGARPGEVCKYRSAGYLYLPNWEHVVGVPFLEPGVTYFLRPNGCMDPTPPTTGYVREVGDAHSDKIFCFRLGPRIKL